MDSDLTSFLEKHGRLYDSETDAYERPPFAADIKEGKNDPIYNAHSYHTKVPPRSIIPYILHYTKPGDVVLDPFCGSGMTGVAAQMCADPPRDILEQFPELVDRVGPRACILNDLSPAACHIAYNYNTPVDIEALKREFERIRAAVKEEFDWLYGTEHYEPAIGIYAPWQPEVASRLKNPPADAPSNTLRDDSERKWEVITRAEVERRLGYKVTALPHDEKWGNLDVSTVDHWICIPATIQYTIWSDVYRCEGIVTIEEPTGKISIRGKNAGKSITRKKRVVRGCGEEVVLWNVARDSADSSRFTCPKCGQIWQKVQVQRIRSIPVVTDLTHPKPSEGTRRLARAISEKERDLIAEIETKPLPHWVPSGSIDLGREMMRHGLLKRGVRTLADFYTKRNLWALSALWAEIQKIKDTRFRSGARFLITSFLPRVSRKAEYRTGGGAGNTHNINIPAIHREDNVMKSLSSKERDILSGLLSLRHFQSKIVPCIVSKRDATSLVHIHDDSIDYIFTDPPFGSNIFYADCSILWESWLGDFTDEKFEIVINERRQGGPFKKLEDYGNMMTSAIHEMYRVLKPGRWATIEFNNSDGAVFEAIKRGVRAAGFEIANMLLLDKQQKTFKQLQGADGQDVVDKDVLFNLHKLTAVQRERRSEDSDLEQQVADAVRDHLATLPARITAEPSKYSDDHRTTATINSMLMNTLIPRGVSVERLNLPFIERLCARYFRKIGQRWYLRGETVGGNGENLVTEEVAVTGEMTAVGWLRQRIQSGPKLTGELKPLWMRATGLLPAAVSRSLDLERLLRENFWRDAATNRWREPTAEEREKMGDDRSLRVMHDADRLADGTFGRTPSGSEICDWITVLFETCRELEEDPAALSSHPGFDKTDGYRLIVKISHHLTAEGLDPAKLSAAKKQAAVAGRRLVESAEASGVAATTTRHRDDKQSVFDLGI